MIAKTLSQNLNHKSFLLFTIVLILFLSGCKQHSGDLPYLGEHESMEVLVDDKVQYDTSYYRVPEFKLTNQDSVLFTQDDVQDKVYVSYFFFTSCPNTCPMMTNAMKRVYKVVGDEADFLAVAHTVDPKRDTPEKLKSFSIKNEINKENWQFLTGDNDYIYDLGMNGYYLSMGKHDAAPGGFIHSSKFILLDRERHIRGIYEGTDSGEVANMIRDIKFLLETED